MPSKRLGRRTMKSRQAFTLVELLAVIVIIVVLIALLIPAVLMAREASRRTQCTSHLKQIGLAVHSYHDSNRCFPPGNVIKQAGVCPGRSDTSQSEIGANWLISILPYLEQKPLYDAYNFRVPNEAPPNQRVRETWIASYVCPSDVDNSELAVPSSGPAAAWEKNVSFMPGSYRAMSGRSEGLRFLDSDEFATYPSDWRGAIHTVGAKGFTTESFTSILDGTSNTWLVGESTSRTSRGWRTFWAYSYAHYTLSAATPQSRTLLGDYDECFQLGGAGKSEPCKRGWGSYHSQCLHFLLCDGSARSISTSIDMELFAQMATVQGGEVVQAP